MGSKDVKHPKLAQQTHMGVFPTAFIALENHCQIKWDELPYKVEHMFIN